MLYGSRMDLREEKKIPNGVKNVYKKFGA